MLTVFFCSCNKINASQFFPECFLLVWDGSSVVGVDCFQAGRGRAAATEMLRVQGKGKKSVLTEFGVCAVLLPPKFRDNRRGGRRRRRTTAPFLFYWFKLEPVLSDAGPAPWDAMAAEDDDEAPAGGGKEGFRSKPRFSYTEVKMLLDEVKRNRHILLKKFNRGVSVDTKKQKWAEITDLINGLGENHREIRQIMKKWADLKCDGKRRMLALRGPNGPNLRKKRLGPVERMVHRILMMSPSRDGGADQDQNPAEDFNRSFLGGPVLKQPAPYSYLSLNDGAESNPEGVSFDMSPLSSPENEPDDLIHSSSELDQADDEDVRQRIRPVFTYSRTNQNQNHAQNSSSSPPTASSSLSSAAPPAGPSPPLAASSSSAPTSGPPPPPPAAPPSSTLPPPPPAASSVPPPASPQDQVTQLASQSLQQQRAGRVLLASVSRSLEVLAQSVQLLVESQQEFVQESLQLQRDTLDVLRDFSNTALRMLRDKNSGQPHPPPPPPPYHHLHPPPPF